MKTLSQDFAYCSSSLEIELLLCCARSSISARMVERVRVLVRVGVNWELLLKKAEQHEVLSLLHKSLDEAAAGLVPDSVMYRLKQHYQTNFSQNFHLTKQVLNLLTLLKEHFVATVQFQGPVLAAMVYGDLGLREFNDLNILVHEQDYLRAKVLLTIHGHHSLQESSCLSFSSDFKQVCNHLHPVEIAGQAVLTFQPEDVLLSLCVEGTKKRWRQLRQVCDVAELLRAYPNLKWEQVFRDAEYSGTEQMLLLGLFLAADWLDAPLPEAIAQKLKTGPICKLLATQGWHRLIKIGGFRNWFGVKGWMTRFRKAKFLQNTFPSELKYFLHSR
jgi:hypothetical protein